MKRHTPTHAAQTAAATKPKLPVLHQQEADFTAEGSPAPGLVGGGPPEQAEPAKPAKTRASRPRAAPRRP